MARIVELGCVACRSEHPESLCPLEVHHLLDGGVRRGHEFTVCLCAWHHRGMPPNGFNVTTATNMFGPSLYHNGRAFRALYGDDNALMAFQTFLLREYSDTV